MKKMKMQRFRRFLAALASLVVGGASFALSYVALRDVSVRLGAVPSNMGWLVPVVIDGGIICGSAIIWALSKEDKARPKFPFFFVGAMVIMSVVVNIAHAGDPILAKVIASLPPIILLGTLEMVAGQGRRERTQAIAAEAAAPVAATVSAAETGVQAQPKPEVTPWPALTETTEKEPVRPRSTSSAPRRVREPVAALAMEGAAEVKEVVKPRSAAKSAADATEKSTRSTTKTASTSRKTTGAPKSTTSAPKRSGASKTLRVSAAAPEEA